MPNSRPTTSFPLAGALSAGRAFVRAASQPLGQPLDELDRVGRAIRRQIADATQRTTLALLDATLFSAIAEEVIERALESPGFDRLIDRVLDSDGVERLVAQVIDSRFFDEAITRLLQSDDLWMLVDEIARSPSVTEAISHQGTSFAGEMAGVFRDRSSTADDRLERLARRVLRRHQRVADVLETESPDAPERESP